MADRETIAGPGQVTVDVREHAAAVNALCRAIFEPHDVSSIRVSLLQLESNLEHWLMDAPEPMPRWICPLEGHDDRWSLDLDGDELWQKCTGTGARIGRITW